MSHNTCFRNLVRVETREICLTDEMRRASARKSVRKDVPIVVLYVSPEGKYFGPKAGQL